MDNLGENERFIMKKNILILTLASLVVGTQVQAADAQTSVPRWAVPAVVITGGAAYMLYNWLNKPVDVLEVEADEVVDATALMRKELAETVATAAEAKRLAREKADHVKRKKPPVVAPKSTLTVAQRVALFEGKSK